jgi:hypothetical protein
MAPSNYDKAMAEQNAASATLAAINVAVKGHTTKKLSEVLVDLYIQQCTNQLQVIMDVNAKLLHMTLADPYAQNDEFMRLFKAASELAADLGAIKTAFPKAGSSSGSGPSHSVPPPKADIKLPQLNIPIFTGNLMEWISFRDMFQAIIHNSSNFSGTQKLSYLKSLVQGEPFRLISSLILSDANYDIAWAQLNARYQNDREFVFAIVEGDKLLCATSAQFLIHILGEGGGPGPRPAARRARDGRRA